MISIFIVSPQSPRATVSEKEVGPESLKDVSCLWLEAFEGTQAGLREALLGGLYYFLKCSFHPPTVLYFITKSLIQTLSTSYSSVHCVRHPSIYSFKK